MANNPAVQETPKEVVHGLSQQISTAAEMETAQDNLIQEHQS
jgi:hypothetical protein